MQLANFDLYVGRELAPFAVTPNSENIHFEKADFRSAYNFSINPKKNRIRKTKFSLSGLSGLLDAYDIEIE
ncbi:MAG: hypothetical protein MI684_11495 [Chlorobiales bacterium]|nr:hypothetical protein [Chlorobiales bacterium]